MYVGMRTGIPIEHMLKIRHSIYTTPSGGKIAVSNSAIMMMDTELDLVLEPAAYREHFLEAKLNNALLRKKRPLSSE